MTRRIDLSQRGGMGVRAPLTAERVRHLLSYDHRTGVFRWRFYRGPTAKRGQIAGRVWPDGYRKITIDGRSHAAGRLAWLHEHGRWPATNRVGYRDGNPANNRITNLREATRSQLVAHSKLRRDNKARLKGVSPFEGKWMANVNKDGRNHYLGLFSTKEKAHAAYLKKARELHGEFARGQ